MARTPGKPGKDGGSGLRIAVVRAEGEVSRAAIEACDWALSQDPDIQGAVVDLSLATHVDYKAAVVLVARRRVLKARGFELAVAAGLTDVRHILRASAGTELQVFPTAEEAMAYVRGEGPFVTAGAPRTPGARRSR